MFSLSLTLHIISGFAALISGCIAIISTKGKYWHVRAGRLFVGSMATVAVTAVHLSLVRFNPFLLLIAIFSFYLTWSGYRAIHWKDQQLKRSAFIFNALFICCMVLSGLVMIGIPLAAWSGIDLPQSLTRFNTVLLSFGLINTVFAGFDLVHLIYPVTNSRFWWLYQHIGRIGGAFISACTAFLVVNVTFLSDLVIWLGPTVIGAPFIAYSIRKYRKKLDHPQICTDGNEFVKKH